MGSAPLHKGRNPMWGGGSAGGRSSMAHYFEHTDTCMRSSRSIRPRILKLRVKLIPPQTHTVSELFPGSEGHSSSPTRARPASHSQPLSIATHHALDVQFGRHWARASSGPTRSRGSLECSIVEALEPTEPIIDHTPAEPPDMLAWDKALYAHYACIGVVTDCYAGVDAILPLRGTR